jgi:predicted nucleotidyltransferase
MLEIGKHKQQLHAHCRRFRVKRLELFGSAATGRDLARTSDLDFLVDLGDLPPAEYADAYFGLKEALERMFSRPVDLLTVSSLRNPFFKQRVEQTKALLYAA